MNEIKVKIEQNDFANLEKPKTLVLSLTNKCNAKCEFCFPQNSEGILNLYHNKNTMDRKLLDSILEQIDSSDTIETVILGGSGEVLLYDNIFDIVKKLKIKNKKVEIQTNGTLLSREDIYELKKLDIDALQISIDAITKETFKKIIHVDKYETFLNTLKISSDLGIDIKTNTVLIKENIDEFNSFTDFLKKHKINISIATFNCVRDDNFMYKKNINMITKKNLDNLYLNISHELNSMGIINNLETLKNQYTENDTMEFKLTSQNPFACNEVFENLTILHTGHYSTCCGSSNFYKFDTNNFSIRDIFNSNIYKELRLGFLTGKPCKICNNKWCEERYLASKKVDISKIVNNNKILEKVYYITKNNPIVIYPAGRLFREFQNEPNLKKLNIKKIVDQSISEVFKKYDYTNEEDFLKSLDINEIKYIFLCTTEHKIKAKIINKLKEVNIKNNINIITLV